MATLWELKDWVQSGKKFRRKKWDKDMFVYIELNGKGNFDITKTWDGHHFDLYALGLYENDWEKYED